MLFKHDESQLSSFITKGFSNDDPDDPWRCVKSGVGNGVIVRGSSEDGLIDIPSRTLQDNFETSGGGNDIRTRTTTDRPSFLPPKETVIGTKSI